MNLTREQVQALKLSRHTVTTPDTTSRLAEALLQAWDEVERLRQTLEYVRDTLCDDHIADVFARGLSADRARQALEVRE